MDSSYQCDNDSRLPDLQEKSRFEVFFHRFDPFTMAMAFYVMALVLAAGSWVKWATPLGRAALTVLCLALLVHTVGLLSRMYISGRPPVPNLYSSAILAGLLAIASVIDGVSSPYFRGEQRKDVARMVYGILCFATLASFVGTVLGGIWADQSWGRFWGWDPKENGAILIVLWNALILHARWGGVVRERGVMVLAVAGNIVTSFSWFGVNMLGIGLPSYGFMDGAVKWLAGFVASQLVIIGLGL